MAGHMAVVFGLAKSHLLTQSQFSLALPCATHVQAMPFCNYE